jgi:ABC-type arginine/histidine transport system permease subunit
MTSIADSESYLRSKDSVYYSIIFSVFISMQVHSPKSIQVFIIYYKVSRYFLIYREIFLHILGNTATFYNILGKLDMSLGQCVLFEKALLQL